MNKTQKGFALIEGLLILIIVLLIGFIGYYVWHTQSQTDKSLDAASNTNQTAPTKKVSDTNASTASSRVEFKEIGVEMTAPGTLSGLSYVYSDGNLYLRDSAINAIYDKCPASEKGGGASEGSFAAIGKMDGQYDSTTADPLDGALIKQFPDFYVTFGVPNGLPCSDQTVSKEFINQGKSDRQAFVDAFKNTATLINK